MQIKSDSVLKTLGMTVLLSLVLTFSSFAQETTQTDEDELPLPPPPKVLSKEEKIEVDAAIGVKERTQLCVKLAEAHLLKAEQLTEASQFDEVLSQIGGYQAIIDNTVNFLQQKSVSENSRVRDNFRRLETMIRLQIPRLEMIRRTTPALYSVHVKNALDFARDARTTALESFYSDTVLRELPMKTTNAFTSQSTGKPMPNGNTDKPTTEKKPE